MEELIQYPHTVMPVHNPNIFKPIVLGHISDVILNKIIDILTEYVHITLPQYFLIVLRVYDKLNEQHEQ
jgi:hypothetical protein